MTIKFTDDEKDDAKAAKDAAKDAPKATPKVEAAPPPLLEGYPDTGQGVQEINFTGVGDPSTARVGKPLPQSISLGGVAYDLSARAAGVYIFRHM